MIGLVQMGQFLNAALAIGATTGALGLTSLAPVDAPPPAPVFLDQGPNWGAETRAEFYKQDQGSRIIPFAWVQALTGPDGKPFLADELTRYGYLHDPASEAKLPIGFITSGPQGSEFLGMTCAACHTRELEVGGKTYRVDGGPAISDFQRFLTDLRDAVGRVRATPTSYATFTTAVLGPGAAKEQIAALKSDVELWYVRQNTLFSKALPQAGWGLGRLDAVSMIFNRLTGLDIGPSPTGIKAENIYPADAPVRYPFIWNAPRQDFTQWPGFAPNGDDILGLVRNLGEVYGVFAQFSPQKNSHSLLNADYLTGNSANFDGLTRLEKLTRGLEAPKWPFPIDPESADRGRLIFEGANGQGLCAGCHGVRDGKFRIAIQPTWATTLTDVQTDSREYDVLKRTADTGVLAGTGFPFLRLGKNERQFDILAKTVAGSIAQKYTIYGVTPATGSQTRDLAAAQLLSTALPPTQQSLLEAYKLKLATPNSTGPFPYEARVLKGVWAAAPYLHNGSVASLAQLLTPDGERLSSFPVGRAYDTVAVGLAKAQPGSTAVRVTTGCDDRNSGNSRCGHNYGTSLTPAQKSDLLEYLKSL